WQKNGDLRGCVGQLQSLEALYKMVQSCAIAAATRDIRFSSVTAAELSELTIEISILSTPEKINSPKEIKIGRHGLIIEQDNPYPRKGLLLPEVAVRHNWNRSQFLDAICQKANLSPDAWRTADLYIFEAEVFAEET
ncbi:MAG TPA: AmmeMemoRadiSam system protein A, partial [Chloroflexi bacterium]|nr:AmmeMemoRadiSam system protein A [Chloroflexota bacterium]